MSTSTTITTATTGVIVPAAAVPAAAPAAAPYKTQSSFFNNRVYQYNWTGTVLEGIKNSSGVTAVFAETLGYIGLALVFLAETVVNIPTLAVRAYQYCASTGPFAQTDIDKARSDLKSSLAKVAQLTPAANGVTIDAKAYNPSVIEMGEAARRIVNFHMNDPAHQRKADLILKSIQGEAAAIGTLTEQLPTRDFLGNTQVYRRQSANEVIQTLLQNESYVQLVDMFAENIGADLNKALQTPGVVTMAQVDSFAGQLAQATGRQLPEVKAAIVQAVARTQSAAITNAITGANGYNKFADAAFRGQVQAQQQTLLQAQLDTANTTLNAPRADLATLLMKPIPGCDGVDMPGLTGVSATSTFTQIHGVVNTELANLQRQIDIAKAENLGVTVGEARDSNFNAQKNAKVVAYNNLLLKHAELTQRMASPSTVFQAATDAKATAEASLRNVSSAVQTALDARKVLIEFVAPNRSGELDAPATAAAAAATVPRTTTTTSGTTTTTSGTTTTTSGATTASGATTTASGATGVPLSRRLAEAGAAAAARRAAGTTATPNPLPAPIDPATSMPPQILPGTVAAPGLYRRGVNWAASWWRGSAPSLPPQG